MNECDPMIISGEFNKFVEKCNSYGIKDRDIIYKYFMGERKQFLNKSTIKYIYKGQPSQQIKTTREGRFRTKEEIRYKSAILDFKETIKQYKELMHYTQKQYKYIMYYTQVSIDHIQEIINKIKD